MKIGHSTEILKADVFERQPKPNFCILKLFTYVHELSLKNGWLLPIFFFDFNKTC